MIRKIKMWYWKHFNKDRYYKESAKDLVVSMSNALRGSTLYLQSLAESLKEFQEVQKDSEDEK